MGGTPAWRRAGAGALVLPVTLVIALVLTGARAHALAPPTPWDGVNPFRCTIQDAGQGTAVPDPGADPYCVRFDKSNQNVTQLGLITFLTEEPARFGAAAPKCFYYQEDHWRGSLIQSDQQTVIYEFYGHYFFNKATGDGGVWVTGFKVAGQTFDPRSLPGFPPQYDQYYGPGTGGFITHNDVPTDPNCVAQASSSPGSVYTSSGSHCLHAHGKATRRRLGPVRLGEPTARIRARFGKPTSVERGVISYCLRSGGSLYIGTRDGPRARGRARTVVVASTGRGFSVFGPRRLRVMIGTRVSRMRRDFPRARRMFHVGRVTFYALAPASDGDGDARADRGAVVVGTVRGRVAYIGIYDPSKLGYRALARYLTRMP